MKRWLACLLLITLQSSTARAGEDVRIRRFALIVGANDGGVDRVKLRVSIGAELNQHIALFAGVSANAAFDIHDGDSGDGISFIKGKRIDADEFVLRLSPGFFAGVSFF